MVCIKLGVFIILMVFLLYKSFQNYSGGEDYDFIGFINIFWMILTAVFIFIWGSIFWW